MQMKLKAILSSTLLMLAMGMVTVANPARAFAQEGELVSTQPSGITVNEIIQRFAAKEKEFKIARENYTWRQSVKVQTMDGDTATGTYEQVVDIQFDNKGKRIEQVQYAPASTLERITMSPEDFQDIEKRLPFVLTSDEVEQYNIEYLGQQKEDELNTYVFQIKPKRLEKGQRYFEGKIWVDDHDFQIVKTFGKNVPDIVSKNNENLFPAFTTYREQIDGKYWFPTYTRVDDTLHFSNGDVRIRQVVKYTNYKRFGSNVKITYEGQEIKPGAEDQQKQPQQQPPTPPKK
jgi:hypothetical protein